MASIPGIPPHGGVLVDRVLRGAARDEAVERAQSLPRLHLSPTSVSDLELIAVGAFSPLTGFMGRADYDTVVDAMRLGNGLAWSLPIVLPASTAFAASVRDGSEIALYESAESQEHLLGTMEVQERYAYSKEHEAREVYRTADNQHPGVARLYAQGQVLLGGPVFLLDRPLGQPFSEFRFDPIQTRRMFATRGWRQIVGFQTRNPIHRAHEYIQKAALEIVDGLFLHPLIGETKDDDIPADVRMASYQAILRDYYPADRVLLGVFPAAMRYAGPREAIFHALCRKNYGCTHFIVGRDHAGVGRYYGTYDAQHVFDQFRPEEIGITPLFFKHAYYCNKCAAVVTAKTCPHGEENWVSLSGSQLRDMLSQGQAPPPEFTRPEVARVLIEGYRSRRNRRGPVGPP